MEQKNDSALMTEAKKLVSETGIDLATAYYYVCSVELKSREQTAKK